VHLGVVDGDGVVYVAKIGGHRQVASPSRIGGRMPLHCTAIGKVLLAYSPPDLVDRVLSAGNLPRRTARTLTAPAAVSVTGPVPGFPAERYASPVKAAAAGIAATLARRATPD
jgi:DNA-binding IclR family transcriptional regulator